MSANGVHMDIDSSDAESTAEVAAEASTTQADAPMRLDVAVVGFSDAVLDEVQRFKTWAAEGQSRGFNHFYANVLKYCDPVVIHRLSGEQLIDVRDSLEVLWDKDEGGVIAATSQRRVRSRAAAEASSASASAACSREGVAKASSASASASCSRGAAAKAAADAADAADMPMPVADAVDVCLWPMRLMCLCLWPMRLMCLCLCRCLCL